MSWSPDGRGLPGVAREHAAGVPVHLRLTNTETGGVQGACNRGLGEWWTGKPSEVTCPACLEVVHA